MELPDSYEAMYERAKKTAVCDRDAGVEQFQRLVNRLLSLPARVLDRRPDLRELLDDVADDYLVLLRWAGRNEEALAEIDRLSQALPEQAELWSAERALNLIDIGKIGEGLDLLRSLLLQRPSNEREIRRILAAELFGAGQYAEATEVAKSLLRDARNNDEREYALDLLVFIAIEADDLREVLRYAQKLRKDTGDICYFICEWLAARGHWDELERLLDDRESRIVKQVFRGEMLRARGDEASARALWKPLLEPRDGEELDVYAFIAVRLLTGQADERVEEVIRAIWAGTPSSSSELLALLAALAQTGHVDDAVEVITAYLDLARLSRPFLRRLPHSYWLRLRRYPMPDEAVEALRPYFVTEQAAAPA